MAGTAPSIKWVQYKEENSSLSPVYLNTNNLNNTIDYGPVQAGKYSDVVCVRPQFDGDSDNKSVGNIQLYMYTKRAANSSTNTELSDITSYKWIIKYYVSDCQNMVIQSSESNIGSLPNDKCLGMLRYTQNTVNKQMVTENFTFPLSSAVSANCGANQCWCQATWHTVSPGTSAIAMQPVPIGSIVNQSSAYSGYTKTQLFGPSYEGSTEDGMIYAKGGDMVNKANIKQYVNNSDSPFPYIFFTIKVPSDTDAGIWHGWSFRMSYMWPYTPNSNNTNNNVNP